MSIGLEIRRRRKALKLTLEDMVDRLDQLGIKTDTGNLSRCETGKQGIPEPTLRAISSVLGCTVGDLYAAGSSNVSEVPLGTRRIPVISYVQAGLMSEACDPYAAGDGGEWLLTDSHLSPSTFALKIKGDSMLPDFREGDTVIIDPAVEPMPGDFVVAKNGENEATFKKYRPRSITANGENVFELVPLNEDYATLHSDKVQIRIIGTMIEHRRYRRR